MDTTLVFCTECGQGQKIDAIHPGEIRREMTCRECGEWFVAHDGRDDEE
jgi:hypothetical protein